ncbi:hypothetical protein K6V98_08215 [Collinsella sp. AGMB00827]|uniref:Uncharacterized protein n=1 Tax=Collinsella ureilytica TaxID=2869515 RepID=A0ABS7MM05_9ACTN|nr:hypothetical protein [Collinsella urealyticum]MBY4798328.1 hypothetical protein [Collinsella urealyticum]
MLNADARESVTQAAYHSTINDQAQCAISHGERVVVKDENDLFEVISVDAIRGRIQAKSDSGEIRTLEIESVCKAPKCH